MSSEKVNKYKEEKKKRDKALKKQKREQLIAKIVVIVIAVALVVWIGISVYQKLGERTEGTDATTVNVDPLNDYLNSLETIEADPDM